MNKLNSTVQVVSYVVKLPKSGLGDISGHLFLSPFKTKNNFLIT